jgi:chromosome segregation ATPase
MKAIVLAVILASVPSTGLCQTAVKEPDVTMQSLLAEVHQLRLDIEAMTVASQRVQIALYSLQMQDAAVARAAQRADNARNKCQGNEGARQHLTSEITRLESTQTSGTATKTETEAAKSRLADSKNELEGQTVSLQTCQAAEAEATSQLRNEQATMVDLQGRISQLDKSLEKLSAAGR